MVSVASRRHVVGRAIMFLRTVICVVVLAMMQTMVEAQRLTSVIGDSVQLVADRLPAPAGSST
ncbi:MAG TPA: hypothetical protein VFI48_07380 [Hyphomicrobiaceae bacterium]|nr:hypothetical protein [Hyphomicrobiaceae bacterium]